VYIIVCILNIRSVHWVFINVKTIKKEGITHSSRLNYIKVLRVEVFCPIISLSVFAKFSSRKLLVIQFFISAMHSVNFVNFVQLGIYSWVSSAVKANSMFPNDIS